ncbi:sensor histidine kinase [uncultured Pigmentiphaga sp.]|uniref:sensor histidine kinase n=1 Tax=uncultured Pigmentiphaga sp. TaxID=340361 RepID=UPI0026086266|nr:sensor histidine kinase [uncultured Pigmentiphaga sp.]
MTGHRGNRARRRSLKSTLLWWMLPALAMVAAGGLWLSVRLLDDLANAAYDRSLAGALRAIDLNISTDSGGLAVELPYRLLQFFELTASGNVYFRVATEDGLAEIGNPDLPLPDHPLRSGRAEFYNAEYFGEPVRVGAMARRLEPPLYGANEGQRIVIQVAESVRSRLGFTRTVIMRAIERDALQILLSALLLTAGVIIALRPLVRLSEEINARGPEDLRPVDDSEVPSEVQPLVAAINRHIARHEAQAKAQRQFLDDASHQLRTPLTVLKTQVDFALRESDPQAVRQALQAMHTGIDRSIRMANQMLALARVHDASLGESSVPFARIDLVELAGECVRSLLPAARAKRLDYGFDTRAERLPFFGSAFLLREALVNLLDNAIRYSPEGSVVTLSVGVEDDCAVLRVEDSGPGMSASDIERAGVRFRRGQAGKDKPGAGLGLAIAERIAKLHKGQLVLENRDPGPGLRASLVFPRSKYQNGVSP